MRNLLTKEKVILLNEYNDSISEAAVHWNQSALGILTNALLKPFSWLKGSIKKGIKRQQIKNLVTQYGMEYVKAIKAVDMPEEAQDVQSQPMQEEPIKNVENNPELLKSIQNEYSNLNTIKKFIINASKWKEIDFFTPNNNKIKDSFKKIKDAYIKYDKELDLKSFYVGLKSFNEKEYEEDSKSIMELQNSINKFLTDLKTYEYDQFVTAYGKQYNTKINKLLQNVNSIEDNFKIVIDHLDVNNQTKLNIGEEYIYTNAKGEEKTVKLISTDKSYKPGPDKIYLTDDDIEVNNLEDGVVFVLFKDKSGKYSDASTTMAVKEISLKKKTNEAYQIFEATEYVIPNRIQDLFSEEQLEEAKKIEDIKKKTFDKINLIALNTIKYNADYIINNNKSTDKEDASNVLRQIWDKGILDINNYFQDVINTDEVTSKVTGTVDAKTKKTIESDQATLTELQQMGLNEVFPVGAKFDINKIYAFQGTFKGQNQKFFKYTLLMSPTINFNEEIEGDKTYWFKLMGAYKYDKKKNENIRINPFLGATNNKKISDNFNKPENAYYVAFTALRPATNSKMFVYSNTGKYFFNNNIYEDVNIISKEILKYKKKNINDTLKELGPISNIFGFTINQRFTIEDEIINAGKFPGVQLTDGTQDKDISNAKKNHKKLMDIIK